MIIGKKSSKRTTNYRLCAMDSSDEAFFAIEADHVDPLMISFHCIGV